MKLRLLRNLRSQQHCPLAASIARAAQHAVKRGLVSAGSGRGLLADTAPAFVFDIDGVLMRGSSVLTEARRALARLYSESGPRVPLAFLTNGGGMLESRRAKVLSQALGVPVSENQVVMAHTPMRSLSQEYGARPVMVCGKGALLDIAASYGFRRVVSTEQLADAFPKSVPISSFSASSEACRAGAGGRGGDAKTLATEAAPIEAVLVMTDPTDWGRDIQLIVDIVSSSGVLTSAPDLPAAKAAVPVPVYIGHADLLWAADWPRPRFGLGAFALALEAVYERATGQALPAIYYGKPQSEPFRLVERLLAEQAEGLGWPVPRDGQSPFDAIFMVGDNPAVDVRGARKAALDGLHPWRSVLVRTGVFQAGAGRTNCSVDPADIVVDNVDDAITAAAHHLRSLAWHSMR